MRELVVEGAHTDDVGAAVRAAVESLGGVVASQSSARTLFDNLRPERSAFSRAGYIGVYHPYGSRHATLRVRVWALWPRRAVTLLLAFGFFATIGLFAARLDASWWFLSGLGFWLGLAVAFLVYAGTFEVSRELEARLTSDVASRVEADGHAVFTRTQWSERIDRLGQAATVKAKQLRSQRGAQSPAPGPEPGRRGRRGRKERAAAAAAALPAAKDEAPAQEPAPDGPPEAPQQEPAPRRRFGFLPFRRRRSEEE